MRELMIPASYLLAALLAAGPRPVAGAGGSGGPDTWLLKRVGGDLAIQTELKVERYTCGESYVEAPLPEGYPAPTPPGAIDLKRYPPVRRAEVSGSGNPDQGRDGAFWSLFNHIKKRDIAMTSPVELDYRGAGSSSEGWTMSFLYRTMELGPVGSDGKVSVVDAEPVTVVSIGVRGPYGRRTVERGLEELSAWIESQSDWESAGDSRALYYNGPSIPDDRKWAEVQIPVRRSGAEASPPATAEIMESPAMTPAQLIELAIQRGAPLFNDEQPEACTAIYEVTARWLVTATPQLDGSMRNILLEALEQINSQHDPREQAWTLRRVLDAAYWSLTAPAQASSH